MKVEEIIKKAIKNIQSSFFHGNTNARQGRFITKEEADDLRKKVTRPKSYFSYLAFGYWLSVLALAVGGTIYIFVLVFILTLIF